MKESQVPEWGRDQSDGSHAVLALEPRPVRGNRQSDQHGAPGWEWQESGGRGLLKWRLPDSIAADPKEAFEVPGSRRIGLS